MNLSLSREIITATQLTGRFHNTEKKEKIKSRILRYLDETGITEAEKLWVLEDWDEIESLQNKGEAVNEVKSELRKAESELSKVESKLTDLERRNNFLSKENKLFELEKVALQDELKRTRDDEKEGFKENLCELFNGQVPSGDAIEGLIKKSFNKKR